MIVLLVLSALPAIAQEALRESIVGEKAAQARKESLENRDYNLKLGRLNFNFAAGLGVEYNDNARYAEVNREEDLILRPQLTAAGDLPLSELNSLSFTIGLNYLAYINNSDLDRIQLTPTRVAFDLFVENFLFTVYDRISYSLDPVNNSAATGSGNFGALDNIAGLDVLWDLNKIVTTAGFGHRIWISSTDDYAYMDRATELFNLRPGYEVNDTLTVGPEGTLTLTAYDEQILHDSLGYSVGAFADWRLSKKLRVRARAGYVSYDFDYLQAPPSSDSERASTYYFNVDISHRLNEFVTAFAIVGHDVQLGVESDYLELLSARVGFNWRLIQRLGLTTYVQYEDGYQPAFARLSGGRLILRPEEDFNRFGAGLGVTYPLMRSLLGSLNYYYIGRQSDVLNRDYQQNSVTLNLLYRF